MTSLKTNKELLRVKRVRPEWVIYKNDRRIGHAKTWTQALSNLVDMEEVFTFRVWINAGIVLIEKDNGDNYKIQKERG